MLNKRSDGVFEISREALMRQAVYITQRHAQRKPILILTFVFYAHFEIHILIVYRFGPNLFTYNILTILYHGIICLK